MSHTKIRAAFASKFQAQNLPLEETDLKAALCQAGLLLMSHHQLTLNDVVLIVMKAALAATEAERVAAQIASQVFVEILEHTDPQAARELVDIFSDHVLH